MTLEGRTLGRYELEALLGQGGMAEVYRARDTSLARTVAVKVIHATHARDPQFLGRFLTEARLVARLEHPGILPVYDFGEEDGLPFLVMQYLEGGTLRERLAGRPIPPALAVSWVAQLAEALDFAHAAGVLHRDVKPANVLVGRGERLALADFGIAKMLESTTGLTSTGMVIGTPVYMAPEQASGKPASPASDRYALAVMAYEVLTGAPPFDGESALALMHQHVTTPAPLPSSRLPGLTKDLDPVFETALAKRPEARHPTCRAFAEALATSLSGAPAAATDASVRPPSTEVLTPPTALRRAAETSEETLPTTLRPDPGGTTGDENDRAARAPRTVRLPAWAWAGALVLAGGLAAAWMMLGGRTDRGTALLGTSGAPAPAGAATAGPAPTPEAMPVTVVEVAAGGPFLPTPPPERRAELLRSFDEALGRGLFDPSDPGSAVSLRRRIVSEMPGSEEAARVDGKLFEALRDDAIRRNARGERAGASALVAEMEILRPADPEVTRLKAELALAGTASLPHPAGSPAAGDAAPRPPAPPAPPGAPSLAPAVAAAWDVLEAAPRASGRLARSDFEEALRLVASAPAGDPGRADVERYCRGGLSYLSEPPRTQEAFAALKDVTGLDGHPLVAAVLERPPAGRPEERELHRSLVLAVGYRDARGTADREFEEALGTASKPFQVRFLRAHLRRAQGRHEDALADAGAAFRESGPVARGAIAAFGAAECDALGRGDALCVEMRQQAGAGLLPGPPGRRPPRRPPGEPRPGEPPPGGRPPSR
ncbi:MAG: serine/threonine protein kinase [Acidobacteria bacterium]|nr:MAG: serine/threonine protein kinase [Acidobacteriota bacterium]